MTEPRRPTREVLAVAREMAKASNAEAARIMGPDAKAWDDLTSERRARSIAAMTPMAQIAVDTGAAVRIARIITHPSLFLVHDAFDRADEKGYTRAHYQEHGPLRLIAAGIAYADAGRDQVQGRLTSHPFSWPFSDGWSPGETSAETLVKAAHLLLSAADVIEAESESS